MEDKGTLTFENWKACNAGEKLYQTLTFEMFSDSDFKLTQDQFGPYKIRKSVEQSTGLNRYFLDIDQYLLFEVIPDKIQTELYRWHSGYGVDEIAALLSLQLGCRLKSGDFYTFKPAGEWAATEASQVLPFGSLNKDVPIFSFSNEKKLLSVNISQATEFDLINLYPFIKADASISLVKAARYYQEAIWIADSQPEFAWLLLVSAIETAAKYWKDNLNYNPVELLMENKNYEKIYNLLKGTPEILKIVATEITKFFKLTKRFQEFFITFKIDPPLKRPSEEYQISFSNEQLKESLSKIYDYRSRALHDGIGFPEPMCRSPHFDRHGVYEKPLTKGQATGTEFWMWMDEDIPMYLNTFEYLVRNTLKKWWRTL